jgi:hypothetical protein
MTLQSSHRARRMMIFVAGATALLASSSTKPTHAQTQVTAANLPADIAAFLDRRYRSAQASVTSRCFAAKSEKARPFYNTRMFEKMNRYCEIDIATIQASLPF